MTKSQFYGVPSLILVGIAIVLGVVAIFQASLWLGIGYLLLSGIAAYVVIYAYCAKCPSKAQCAHVLPGKAALAIQRKLGVRWSCWGRVTPCTQKLLETIARAGCWLVSFGIESGNQDLLDKLQKGMTLEKCRKVVAWAHQAGIETHGTFMLAIPGETPEKAEKTIDFAIELDLTYAAFIPTHPLYGTPLFETCISEGRLVKSPYSHEPVQTRYLPRISYVPEGYKDEKEVEQALTRAYGRFYFRPAYWWKHVKKLATGYSFQKYWTGARFALALSRGWINEGDSKFAVRYSSTPVYDRKPASEMLLAIAPADADPAKGPVI